MAVSWQGEGTVIARRPHGEHAVIVDVLTRDCGRLAGVVPGGASVRRAAMLQPGSRIALRWRARAQGQLGTITPEPARSRAAILADRDALAGLNAVCAMLVYAMPDHDPHPRLTDATEALLDGMAAGADWPAVYLQWELMLLSEMGFALDLSACAVTGARQGLAYVSPRTGRAVSAQGAGEWVDKLLILPAILGGPGNRPVAEDLALGLRLTGHFLETGLAGLIGRPLPAARARLIARLTPDQG